MTNDKPVIEFIGYKIDNLKYTRGKDVPALPEGLVLDEQGNSMQLKLTTGITQNKQNGLVNLNLTLINESINLFVELEMSGEYNIIDESLTIDEIEGYLSMNGTAILFPYVRTVVSIVSSLDANEAVILPTINTKIFGK